MVVKEQQKIILNEDDIRAALRDKFGPGIEKIELSHYDNGHWGGEVFSATIIKSKENPSE